MNTQYTPSHWINDGAEISACVDPAHPSYIAPICSLDTDWHPDIVAANARLIAAAPDLLAALQMVNRVWSHDQTANLAPDSPVAIVRAAITKATGEN
jgi:hypothetical protein